ncbi:MAG TPA: hypothetical protein PLX97_05565, partial [Gemmatales bacterium]|nr:hypothetical protein [Gemmatales bacterium]
DEHELSHGHSLSLVGLVHGGGFAVPPAPYWRSVRTIAGLAAYPDWPPWHGNVCHATTISSAAETERLDKFLQ